MNKISEGDNVRWSKEFICFMKKMKKSKYYLSSMKGIVDEVDGNMVLVEWQEPGPEIEEVTPNMFGAFWNYIGNIEKIKSDTGDKE